MQRNRCQSQAQNGLPLATIARGLNQRTTPTIASNTRPQRSFGVAHGHTHRSPHGLSTEEYLSSEVVGQAQPLDTASYHLQEISAHTVALIGKASRGIFALCSSALEQVIQTVDGLEDREIESSIILADPFVDARNLGGSVELLLDSPRSSLTDISYPSSPYDFGPPRDNNIAVDAVELYPRRPPGRCATCKRDLDGTTLITSGPDSDEWYEDILDPQRPSYQRKYHTETDHPLVTPNSFQGTNSLRLSIPPRSSSDPGRTVPFSVSLSHGTPHDARRMTRVDPLHGHQRSTSYLEGPRTTTRAGTVHSRPPTLPPSRIPIAASHRQSPNARFSGSSSSSSRIVSSRSSFASAFGHGTNDYHPSSTNSSFSSSSSQRGCEGNSLDSRDGQYNARSHRANQARRR